MTRGRAGSATLVLVGVIDDASSADIRAKAEALLAFPHVSCLVIDVRATSTADGLGSELLARISEQARSAGKEVVLRTA